MQITRILEIFRFNKLWDFGSITKKIEDFPDELWNKIEKHYYCGNPLSVLLQNGFNDGKCYDRSYALTMVFDKCNLVRGTLPRFGKIKGISYDPDFGHGWVEDEKYVYDTTLLKRINKEYYYKMFGAKVDLIISSEELNQNENYRKMKNTTKEDIENSIGIDAVNAWLMKAVLENQEKSTGKDLSYLKCKVPQINMDEIEKKQDKFLREKIREEKSL